MELRQFNTKAFVEIRGRTVNVYKYTTDMGNSSTLYKVVSVWICKFGNNVSNNENTDGELIFPMPITLPANEHICKINRKVAMSKGNFPTVWEILLKIYTNV